MDNSQEQFKVRNEEAEAALRNIGHELQKEVPEGFGFAVLVFGFDKKEGMFYLLNAERTSMIEAMKELIGNLEKK